jgi:hypothetical protein
MKIMELSQKNLQQISRLALKIVVIARQEARGKRQEARVKKFSAILHFFTQFGFIVFTYLFGVNGN